MKRREARTEPLARLNAPLVRTNGELLPTTWDHALDTAAQGFSEILNT